MPSSTQYSLKELAEATGLTSRTLRYYVAEGLLAAPVGLGRTAHYTQEHKDALDRIQGLKGEGRSIREIRAVLVGDVPHTPPQRPEVSGSTWERHLLGDDVEVLINARLSSHRRRQVDAALVVFRDALTNADEESES